jgi:hypothetical protein
MTEAFACSCAICRASLATPVEEVIREATFVPLMLPCKLLASVDAEPPRPHGLKEAIDRAVSAELGPLETPSIETLLKAVSITLVDPAEPKARELLDVVDRDLRRQAQALHDERQREFRRTAVDKLPTASISKAATPAIALKRLAGQLRENLGLFAGKTVSKNRTADALCPFDELGLLFQTTHLAARME